PLAAAESLYLELRDVRDRLDVAAAGARDTATDGTPVASLATRHHELRGALIERLGVVDTAALGPADRRALTTMRGALDRALAPLSGAVEPPAEVRQPDCRYDPAAVARTRRGADSLRARIYACYSWAQHHVVVGG